MLLLAVSSVAMNASHAQEHAAGDPLSPRHLKAAQHSNAPTGYTVEPAPSWVTPSPNAEETDAESSVPMSYRLVDEQYQLGEGSETHYLHVIRAINQSTGLDRGSRIEIQFDPSFQKLALHRLELVRAGKRLNRLDRKYELLRRETQLERQMYDGRETLSIVLDDVRVGDEIDYAYSLRGGNPVFGGKFVALVVLGNPIGPETTHEVRLLGLPNRQIHYAMGHEELHPEIRTVGGQRETVFRKDHIPRLDVEPGTPADAFIDKYLQLSEFADWAEVARWGASIFPRDAKGPLLDQETDAIRAQASTAPDRVLVALEFVQKQIRYFGTEIGPYSHRPASPETVLNRRYGDCKDKVALLSTLLDRIDIRATPILVSATMRGAAAQLLPSPLVFDHVIVRVDLDAQSYYLDATRAEQTGTLANREPAGLGRGLPLKLQDSALVALPAAFGIEHLAVTDTFRFERMDVDPTLESRVVFRGDLAEVMRDVIAKQGPEAIFKQLTAPYLKVYPEAHTTAPMTVESSKDDDVLTLVNNFVVPGFFSPSDGILRTAQLVPFAVTDALGFPAAESRHTALGFQFPGIVRHTSVIKFPEDVFPKADPMRRFEGGDAHLGLLQIAQNTRRMVEILNELSINVDQVDPDDWPAFSKSMQELRPHLYTTVRIPVVTNLGSRQRPADTDGTGSDAPQQNSSTADRDLAMAEEALVSARSLNAWFGRDIRGRLATNDINEVIEAMKKDSAVASNDARRKTLDEDKQRLTWLGSYWNEYPALTHNRDLWTTFLQKNRWSTDMPHQPTVVSAEAQLQRVLKGPVSAEWAERARVLRQAYIDERRSLVMHPPAVPRATPQWVARTSACPPPAPSTSGGKMPKVGTTLQSLETLWPAESKRLGEEGTVLATIRISASGCVTGVSIAGSSGSDMMDTAVRSYLESVEFLPAELNGTAVESVATLPVVFKLDQNVAAPAFGQR
jgi:TonB family protein